jgi:hypothetical protein
MSVFGALYYYLSNPGLTAGPILFRPFRPLLMVLQLALGYAFQKTDPDSNDPFQNDYGMHQELYLNETDLPK